MSPRRQNLFCTRAQRGFSMVEMLMAAFVLAIGILGLSMLQTMSLRSTTSSRGLNTAVLVAERVLDEIEANGRNSQLYVRAQPTMNPVTAGLTAVFTTPAVAPPAAPSRTYNFAGRLATGDPIDPTPYFRVYIQPQIAAGDPGVVVPVPGLGGVANMVVMIQWLEDGSGVARQVVLSRRVAYATA